MRGILKTFNIKELNKIAKLLPISCTPATKLSLVSWTAIWGSSDGGECRDAMHCVSIKCIVSLKKTHIMPKICHRCATICSFG